MLRPGGGGCGTVCLFEMFTSYIKMGSWRLFMFRLVEDFDFDFFACSNVLNYSSIVIFWIFLILRQCTTLRDCDRYLECEYPGFPESILYLVCVQCT